MQKHANLVELEKCCQTHIFLQNFVLIQPRTSPPKIYKFLQSFAKNLLIFLISRPGPGRRPALRSSSTPRARRWPSPPQQRSPSRLARPTFMLSIFLTFGEFLASFERPVLGCIEADFCKQILVRIRIVKKLLTRSTWVRLCCEND